MVEGNCLVVLPETAHKSMLILVMIPAHCTMGSQTAGRKVEQKLRLAMQCEEGITNLWIGEVPRLVLLQHGFDVFLDMSVQSLDSCEPTTDRLHIKVINDRQRMYYMNVSCNRQRTALNCRLLV
jgi:hypothetical protein